MASVSVWFDGREEIERRDVLDHTRPLVTVGVDGQTTTMITVDNADVIERFAQELTEGVRLVREELARRAAANELATLTEAPAEATA